MPIPEYPLPADLPEDWQPNQIVAPNGPDVGETEQHGYNYLMEAVNRAHDAINNLVVMANSVTADSSALQAGSIVLTIPGEAQHGMSIKFEAPCNSEDVSVGIVVEGVLYQWHDTLGEDIAGMEALFVTGTMVGIIIDRENVIAYLVNAAPSKGYIEYPAGSPPAVMVPGALYGEIGVDYSAGS